MNKGMKKKKICIRTYEIIQIPFKKFLNKTKSDLNAIQFLGLLTSHNLTFQNNY